MAESNEYTPEQLKKIARQLDYIRRKRQQYEREVASAPTERHAALLRRLIATYDRIISKWSKAGG